MINADLSFDEYRAIEAINASQYKEHYNSSTEQILESMKVERKASKAMDLGTVIHSVVLEPDLPMDDVAVWSGGHKRGKAWTEFKEDNDGRLIITQEQMDALPVIAENVHKDKDARRLLAESTREVTLEWVADCGANCKARLDILNDGGMLLSDVKTMEYINKFKFWSQVDRMGYWLQAGHYIDGAIKCYDLRCNPEFWFLCIETKPPYSVICRPMSGEYLEFARREAHKMVTKIHIAHVTGSIETLADKEGIEEIPMPKKHKQDLEIKFG